MKKKFIEYHIEENLEKIFNEATIVLDTNSLLNLYRYSRETRIKYLEILSNVEDRIFLTHNICTEFYKNRYVLIANRLVFKKTIIELIEEYNGKLLNIVQSSSCGSNKYNNALSILKHEDELRNKIIEELDKSIKKLKRILNSFEEEIDIKYLQNNDPILTEVVRMYNNKVSSEIPYEEKEKIYKEGSERYKKQTPPGYKDIDKPEPDRYGDLIIWKELEKLSITLAKDILFVSDDLKEDWIIDFKGTKLGPRKELIKEFYNNTKHLFYSITSKDFIKLISEKFSVKDIESLEKETEVIQDKIKEEGIVYTRYIDGELMKQKDAARALIEYPLDRWQRSQELLNNSLKDPLENWRRSQELINDSMSVPLERWKKSQELLNYSLKDPLENWRRSQELLNDSMSVPFERWKKSQELLNNSSINPLKNPWETRESLETTYRDSYSEITNEQNGINENQAEVNDNLKQIKRKTSNRKKKK